MKHGRLLAHWLRALLGTALWVTALPATGQAALLPAARAATAGRAAATSPAMGWQIQLVDQRGNAGAGLSMDLSADAPGQPHIAYYDLTSDRSLKYATWDGVAWTTDTVDPDLGSIDASGLPLATGIAWFGGKAHIVYQSFDRAAGGGFIMRYAVGSPGNWTISPLGVTSTGSVPYAPALRRDPNNTLHLSYTLRQAGLAEPSDQVIYARLVVAGNDWVTQTVDTRDNPPARGLVTSLALDGTLPQIVYGAATLPEAGTLTWARLNGAVWQTAVVTDSAFLPSIAVDLQGTPQIAFRAAGLPGSTLQYGKWTGSKWQFQQLCACASQDNQAPNIGISEVNLPTISAESKSNLINFHFDGVEWHSSQLPGTALASRSVLAFDGLGQARLGYYDGVYGDLYYANWGPDWITHTVAPSGDEARLAIDAQALPYISYSTTNLPNIDHQVSLANWVPGGDWQRRVALPSSAPGSFLQVYDNGSARPDPALTYLDDTDPARPHLGYAVDDFTAGGFLSHTVDRANGTGFSASMALRPQFIPVIAYFDMGGDIPRIKLAVAAPYIQWFDIYTDTASYPPFASPLASGTAPICCADYVAYFDLVNNTLRMATWDGSLWSDMLVDSFNGQVISPSVSLAVDQTTGEPAIAYSGSSQSEVRYAVWRAGSFVTQTVAGGLGTVGDVSLALEQSSDAYARIAYTAQADKSLKLAWTTGDTTTWTIDTVATFNTDPTSGQRVRVSSRAQQRDQLAFSSPEMGVVYAFRAATLPYGAGYNPLQPCLDAQAPPSASLGRALARVRALAPAALGQVDDLTTLRALRDLFALSPAGRRYISLYYQYARETGALGLADPSLLWDSYRALQNFLPGFTALAAGQGDRFVITQAMLDQANNIADRLAAAGSPALRSAINAERARYNHLQAFQGLTFAQAASLMGIAGYRTYLPLVKR